MRQILFFTIIILSACTPNKQEIQEVNLYSQRHYAVDELQYKNFTEKTGIKVNVVKANADQLIERLKNEGDDSPADLFVTVDAGKLYNARQAGVLQKISSENINENIISDLRDPDGFWAPITYRSRIIVYSNDRVKKSDLNSYEDLANPKWKGRYYF